MKITDFIRIGEVRFDLNRIYRYWAKDRQIGLDDGNMHWTLSFDTNADRDAALALIDAALIEPVVRPPEPPASITFSRGDETKTIPLK